MRTPGRFPGVRIFQSARPQRRAIPRNVQQLLRSPPPHSSRTGGTVSAPGAHLSKQGPLPRLSPEGRPPPQSRTPSPDEAEQPPLQPLSAEIRRGTPISIPSGGLPHAPQLFSPLPTLKLREPPRGRSPALRNALSRPRKRPSRRTPSAGPPSRNHTAEPLKPPGAALPSRPGQIRAHPDRVRLLSFSGRKRLRAQLRGPVSYSPRQRGLPCSTAQPAARLRCTSRIRWFALPR